MPGDNNPDIIHKIILSIEHVRFVLDPSRQKHGNQPQGSRVKSGQRGHPKLATTNAHEHLLSRMSPSRAWEPLKVKARELPRVNNSASKTRLLWQIK